MVPGLEACTLNLIELKHIKGQHMSSFHSSFDQNKQTYKTIHLSSPELGVAVFEKAVDDLLKYIDKRFVFTLYIICKNVMIKAV